MDELFVALGKLGWIRRVDRRIRLLHVAVLRGTVVGHHGTCHLLHRRGPQHNRVRGAKAYNTVGGMLGGNLHIVIAVLWRCWCGVVDQERGI